MKQLFKSKRFVITVFSIIIWLVCVLGFNKDSLQIASSISLIAGIYGLSESLRPSKKE